MPAPAVPEPAAQAVGWKHQTLVAAALGLGTGACFVLPVLAMLLAPPGGRQTAALILSGIIAVLGARRLGRLLLQRLDACPRPWRLPLIGLYGLVTMAVVASLLFRLRS